MLKSHLRTGGSHSMPALNTLRLCWLPDQGLTSRFSKIWSQMILIDSLVRSSTISGSVGAASRNRTPSYLADVATCADNGRDNRRRTNAKSVHQQTAVPNLHSWSARNNE